MLIDADLRSLSQRWPVALPFLIAAGIILANSAVAWKVRKKAQTDINDLFAKVNSSNPEVVEEDFVAVAMWTADAASGLVSVAGLIAAEVLLRQSKLADRTVFDVILIAAVVVPMALLLVVALGKPKQYGKGLFGVLSWFQVVLLAANTVLGIVIWLVG